MLLISFGNVHWMVSFEEAKVGGIAVHGCDDDVSCSVGVVCYFDISIQIFFQYVYFHFQSSLNYF